MIDATLDEVQTERSLAVLDIMSRDARFDKYAVLEYLPELNYKDEVQEWSFFAAINEETDKRAVLGYSSEDGMCFESAKVIKNRRSRYGNGF